MAPNRKNIAAVGVAGLISTAMVSAQVGGDPTALQGMPVEGAPVPFCQYAGNEYAGRWSIPDPELNDPNSNWGVPAADVAECATICSEEPECMGTSFLTQRAGTGEKACWLKTWTGPEAAVPCQPPAGEEGNYIALIKGECDQIVFMDSQIMDCEAESALPKVAMADAMAPAEGPMMAPEIMGYQVYLNQDYVPQPGMTTEYDIEGIDVMTAEECADQCNQLMSAPQPCNAFSWYGDADLVEPFQHTCYLKYIPDCMLPMEGVTQHDDGRIIAIMNPETCPPPPTAQTPQPATVEEAPATVEEAPAPFQEIPQQTTAQQPVVETGNGASGLQMLSAAGAAVAFAMYLA